jgi:L-lactate dehydrogenase (cytochrome)
MKAGADALAFFRSIAPSRPRRFRAEPARPEQNSGAAQISSISRAGHPVAFRPNRGDPVPVITTIEDLRVLHKKRVPRMFYDYCDSGSWTESTYRANEADFEKIKFRQRVAVNKETRTTRVRMAGQEAAMPVAIAPTGLTGMQHADGEILAARAAKKFGIPFTLSTMSICSIEDVAKATDNHPFWFQLYVMRDRSFIERLIDRAKAANCSALVLTLDLQMIGQRHKDIVNGLSAPPKLTLKNMLNMMSKPAWSLEMLRTPRRNFGNIFGHVKGIENMGSLSEWTAKQFDPALSWKDIEWIKSRWGGKLILKGVQDVEDARIAADTGADALIVSNHGGRQLDGAPSSISALPAIVDAVGSRMEVHMDGGIRSGQSVLKAWALGARGTYIGRSMLYGLGAMGEQGVTKALEIIQKELDLTMAFCGHTDINKVDKSILLPGTY